MEESGNPREIEVTAAVVLVPEDVERLPLLPASEASRRQMAVVVGVFRL